MELTIIYKLIILVVGVLLSAFLLTVGLSLLKSSPIEYQATSKATGGFSNALKGKVDTHSNGNSNINSSAGMVTNLNTKRTEGNGKVSDETISNLLPLKVIG